MRQLMTPDRVGLGWRNELAASIFSNLEQIDVVEVIVDDYFHASKSKLRSVKMLAAHVPVLYHGVGLGLASSIPVDEKRLGQLARTLDFLGSSTWSEHLSFVRAGGHEIGHLAAPPRSAQTIEGSLINLERIKQTVGSSPALENIATLIDPPGSTLSEVEWIAKILCESQSTMLLDLHNLYANALNFGLDPVMCLRALPLEAVRIVHLSGGHWIPEPKGLASSPTGARLLDDHVHDVPEAVYELLEILAREVRQPLTVIIERDGQYPEFQSLLKQMRWARESLKRGREFQWKKKGDHHECPSF